MIGASSPVPAITALYTVDVFRVYPIPRPVRTKHIKGQCAHITELYKTDFGKPLLIRKDLHKSVDLVGANLHTGCL